MSARRRVIIEAPFAADRRQYAAYLAACIRDCLVRGETPYSSVACLALTGALHDELPEERAIGMQAGHDWYHVADAAVVYADHGISSGMQQGIDVATVMGLPIEHRFLFNKE